MSSSAPPLPAALDEAGALMQAGRWQEAYGKLESMLDQAPDCPDTNYRMGLAACRLGRFEEACDFLQLALHYRPDSAPSWIELGAALEATGRLDEALETLRQAVRIDPASAPAYRRLGVVGLKLRVLDEAEAALRRAVELAPLDPYAASDLAYFLLRERGDSVSAIALLNRALECDASCVDAHVNLGIALHQAGRYDGALAQYETALALDSAAHEARLNRGLIRLMRRDFRNGWLDYDARKHIAATVPGMNLNCAEWSGEPVAGKRIVVYGEQGLGDELMFASCIADIAAIAERTALYCSPRLEALFRRSFPQVDVSSGPQVGVAGSLSGLPWRPDYKIAVGTLPMMFRANAGQFSRSAAYLKADPRRVRQWRERLAALGAGLKVGISWRGGTATTGGALRSIAPEKLAPVLATAGTCFVSVQYGTCEDDIAAARAASGVPIARFAEIDADFEQTAALIEALDLVISVCTAVVHLGGGLGKTVWVLVPAVSDWRYMEEGETMPWYPAVKLLRQRREGDWDAPVQALSRRLQLLAAARCS